MKITFIKPKIGDGQQAPYVPVSRMEPLSLAMLGGLTPTDIETVLYDDRIEPIPFDEPTDLAAITVESFSAKRAYSLAREFRTRGVPVVLGGFHPSFMPEEALEHADAVAVGEAEGVWGEIIKAAAAGKLSGIYRTQQPPALEGIIPDRRLFSGKDYLPVDLVQFSRGCNHSCGFCSIKAFYSKGVHHRPVGEVIEEIQALSRKTLFFVDDNLIGNKAAAVELLEALIPLKKRWMGQIGLDFVKDPELMDLIIRSGCFCVVVGFETLKSSNLKQMGKGYIKGIDYSQALRKIRKAGIMVYGTFIFGYDQDTVDVFDQVLEFSIKQKLFLANFNHLMPYPGTELFDTLRDEGRLIYPKWWIDPDYRYGQAVFKPRGMSAEELTVGCYQNRFRFNRFRTICSRALDLRANLKNPFHAGLFFKANMIARKDIRNKQNIALGMGEEKLS